MREIELSNGSVALVDDQDFGYLSQFSWHQNSRKYAFRWVSREGKRVSIFMHNEIMKPQSGQEVDHRDHDKLNNTRSNLRIGTHQQNMWNNPGKKNSTSQYKGVHWERQRGKWKAVIKVGQKCRILGRFSSEHDAARAYNDAALEHFGEFAWLNKIEGDPTAS